MKYLIILSFIFVAVLQPINAKDTMCVDPEWKYAKTLLPCWRSLKSGDDSKIVTLVRKKR